MKISTNQFVKKTINKGVGFTDQNLHVSSNSFAKRAIKKSVNTFQGDNTSETAYGVDDMFGGPNSTYGETPYNGIDHFKLRQLYDLSH